MVLYIKWFGAILSYFRNCSWDLRNGWMRAWCHGTAWLLDFENIASCRRLLSPSAPITLSFAVCSSSLKGIDCFLVTEPNSFFSGTQFTNTAANGNNWSNLQNFFVFGVSSILKTAYNSFKFNCTTISHWLPALQLSLYDKQHSP